jgi:hypothetical protein
MTWASGDHRHATPWALVAELNEQHFRALRVAWLRWAAAASFPVWLQAEFDVLPDLLAFWALLAQGLCLLMFLVSAGLESLWRRRRVSLEGGDPKAVVETLWGPWQELRAALWQGLALVSLVPFVYVALGRPFPSGLLPAAVATGVAVLLLAVVAETIPRLGARVPKRLALRSD